MGNIEWAVWANEQAVISASIIVFGGLIGCFYPVINHLALCLYSIFFGIFVFVFEYPRGLKNRKITGRRYQKALIPLLTKCGVISRNYFVRFTVYTILLLPCCFTLPTLMGSACLFTAGVVYLIAAIKGEEWKPINEAVDEVMSPVSSIEN